MNKNDLEIAQKLLSNPKWRINNLYHIVDKQGNKTLFKLNWAQEELYDNMWYCNIILKARQLGMSTFICLLFLDRCLFNSNVSAGIICHTLEDGQQLFRRVKFAYDSLPEDLKKLVTADNDTSQMLKFSNGSSIRVGMSLRSSTFQFLHISEFGKICAKYPDKATEIITGSLNTLAAGQNCFIESTSEGREGYFYEMCKRAQALQDARKEHSKLDFRFHFYPWWREPTYKMGSAPSISQDLQEYFISLLGKGIKLTEEQKNWYALRYATQGEHMKREYPSTAEECWETSNEGCYYGKYITQARIDKRIGYVPYEESLPVFTAWDLGYNDSTTIWFFQIYGKEIRLIDYIEGSGESLSYWLGVIKSKEYIYEKHLAPHDVMVHEYSSGMTRQASARKMGINLIQVKKVDIIPGIDAARNIFNRCWFDEKKCEKGIKALENYKKEWNDRTGCWASQPLHNWASHGCFTGDTLILTRCGMYPIMFIQKDMEILTLEGWKKCNKATITKHDADLVAVTFEDGMTVRCTPDHLFLTEKGWISAKHLEKGLKIQSSLMFSQSISEEVYTEYGLLKDISRKVAHICIEMFGKMPLVTSLKDVISIIETMISKITTSIILNVFQKKFIYAFPNQIQKGCLNLHEIKQANGINQTKVESGIEDKQSDAKVGQSGNEKNDYVYSVKKNLIVLSEKMDLSKNFAQANANQPIVEKVELIAEKQDVYCINVPEVAHFSLANGAIVHNSDAFRTLATGLHYITGQRSETDIARANLEQARDASGCYPGSYMYTPSPRFPGGKSSIFGQ